MSQEILTSGGENAQPIVQWDPNSGAQLPAYLADAMGELGTNIPDRQTVPSLSYEGKTWQIIKEGNKTKLQAANSDGDMVPIPIMRVVVLNFNADRGRAYYTGTYDPSRTDRPKCWSADGRTPDPSVQEKQSAQCNGCPMSVKGSKVQDGKEMVACSQHRMLAVVPGYDIQADPLRLKIAVTSDYDKEIVEHGWFAFRQYIDFLKARGITHTGLVITKIKFDPNAQYPKLLFSLDRILTPEELSWSKQQLANPKVQELLAEKWTAAGSAGTPTDDSDIRPHGLEGAYADGWQAHPDAAGYSYKGQEVITNEELAARYPAPEPTPAAPAAPTAPPPPVDTPAPTNVDPLDAARADGWVPHPDAEGYHYKGTDVVLNSDLVARYSARVEDAAPPAPQAPPPAPEPEPTPAHDPHAAALADGWVQHPESEPHGYKGQEVLDWPTIHAKYPPASGATPAAGNGAATSAPAAPAGDGSGQTATSGASPSDPASDPALQALLNKWTG